MFEVLFISAMFLFVLWLVLGIVLMIWLFRHPRVATRMVVIVGEPRPSGKLCRMSCQLSLSNKLFGGSREGVVVKVKAAPLETSRVVSPAHSSSPVTRILRRRRGATSCCRGWRSLRAACGTLPTWAVVRSSSQTRGCLAVRASRPGSLRATPRSRSGSRIEPGVR